MHREFQVDYFIRASDLLDSTASYLGFHDLGKHPVPGRSWLSVEVGKYGEPKSIRVQLGPGGVEPALDACATKVLEALPVPDESSIALFTLEVFAEAVDAVALPTAEPGQRVGARDGAGCYRGIEEPPCPPCKRCYADRRELSRCPG